MGTTSPSAHHRHHTGWTPQTRPGTWTVGLATLGLGGIVALAAAIGVGAVEPGEGFTDSWLVTGWGIAILLSATASVATGGVALVRRHDRSWGVVAATAVGTLVTVATLMQVAEGLGWLSS
jgi:hypothetical protein